MGKHSAHTVILHNVLLAFVKSMLKVVQMNQNDNHPCLPDRGLGSEHMVQILSYTRRPINMRDSNHEKTECSRYH